MFTFQVQHNADQALRAPQMVEHLLSDSDDGLDQAVHDTVFDGLQAAAANSPVWTGTLQASHTGEMTGFAEGRIFLRPGLINPILGGDPSIYGPMDVHPRKPWFEQTARDEMPGIIERHTEVLGRKIEATWRLF